MRSLFAIVLATAYGFAPVGASAQVLPQLPEASGEVGRSGTRHLRHGRDARAPRPSEGDDQLLSGGACGLALHASHGAAR